MPACDVSTYLETLVAGRTAALAAELHARVVARTPRDTGLAAASWRVGVGKPDLELGSPGDDTSVAAQAAAQAARLEGYRLSDGPVHVSNAAPHAAQLEHGSSRQAPQGMLRVSLEEVRRGI